MQHDTSLAVLSQRPPQDEHPLLLVPTTAQPATRPARSLYIHVPFCFHKCHYCDFYSIVDNRGRQEALVDRLSRELRALAPWAAPLQTIFVGGGTPTLLTAPLWQRLLDALHDAFDLSLVLRGEGEFTVECNPETADPHLFDTLVAGGVNRLSIGAQSFNPRHLETLERWHQPESVSRAVGLARRAGIHRLSLDLIFAIPGQTLEHWRDDLWRALDLHTTHLSCYDLTYEPNTAMTARLRRGEFQPAPEDTEADMYELTVDLLRTRGLHRYEVSNFALPGHECRHNLAYWRQDPWLAAGPSASAHMPAPPASATRPAGSYRWKNVPRLDDYLTTELDRGLSPFVDCEPPEPGRLLAEKIMTGLRLAVGIDAEDTLATTSANGGESAAHHLAEAARRWQATGHLAADSARWRLTDAGYLLADRIAADLMSVAAWPRSG